MSARDRLEPLLAALRADDVTSAQAVSALLTARFVRWAAEHALLPAALIAGDAASASALEAWLKRCQHHHPDAPITLVQRALAAWAAASLEAQRLSLGDTYAALAHAPDTRKQRGIFYTPTAPVARLLDWAMPPSLSQPVRVLDPACGAGAFLIPAALKLLQAGLPAQVVLGELIHGLDLDEGAVALTRAQLMALGVAHILDDAALDALAAQLQRHIRVEDALTYSSAQGFEVILTNPPYVLTQALPERLRARLISATYKVDLYTVFIELCLGWLKPDGRLGALTPSTFLTNINDEPLRRLLLTDTTIEHLALVEGQLFEGVSADVVMMVCLGSPPAASHRVSAWRLSAQDDALRPASGEQTQAELARGPGARLVLDADDAQLKWCERLEQACSPLSVHCDAYFGAQTHSRERFVRAWSPDEPIPDGWAPCLDGAHIQPLRLLPPDELVSTDPTHIKSGGRAEIHNMTRVVVRQIGKTPIAALAPAGRWALNTVYQVYTRQRCPYSPLFFLALLQSDVVATYWQLRHSDPRRTFPKIKKQALLSIPVPELNLEDPSQRDAYDSLIALTAALIASPDDALREQLNARVASLYEAALHAGQET